MAMTPTLIGDVHFTHKEKELLELFSRSPGECFSRRFLLTTIWPGFPFWPWHGHRIHPRCAEYHVFSR